MWWRCATAHASEFACPPNDGCDERNVRSLRGRRSCTWSSELRNLPSMSSIMLPMLTMWPASTGSRSAACRVSEPLSCAPTLVLSCSITVLVSLYAAAPRASGTTCVAAQHRAPVRGAPVGACLVGDARDAHIASMGSVWP